MTGFAKSLVTVNDGSSGVVGTKTLTGKGSRGNWRRTQQV